MMWWMTSVEELWLWINSNERQSRAEGAYKLVVDRCDRHAGIIGPDIQGSPSRCNLPELRELNIHSFERLSSIFQLFVVSCHANNTMGLQQV